MEILIFEAYLRFSSFFFQRRTVMLRNAFQYVCYFSRIDNGKQQAQIHCHIEIRDFVTANSLYPNEYATTSDGKWKGFEGVTPDTFETVSMRIEMLLQLLLLLIRRY